MVYINNMSSFSIRIIIKSFVQDIFKNTISMFSYKKSKKRKLQENYCEMIIANNMKTVKMGIYYQDKSNVKQPLEWLVLDHDNNEALLITKYCIDCVTFNDSYDENKDVHWDESTIRNWLNSTFFNNTFDKNEQRIIVESNVSETTNKKYNQQRAIKTRDRVFLLSAEEASSLFTTNDERQAKATSYACCRGANTGKNGYAWWWLRTPGAEGNHACNVFKDGSIHYLGHNNDMNADTVRPAIRISLRK